MVKIILLIVVVLFNTGDTLADEDNWQKKGSGIYETALTSIIKTPSGKLFASTDKAIYASSDNGDSWQRLAFLPGSKTNINDVAYVDGDYFKIYAATTNGLYRIINKTGAVDCIYKTWREYKKDVRCIRSDDAKDEKLYIGTRGGLFTSNDSGKRWKAIGYFKNKQISDITFLEKDIFIAADDGIYKGSIFSNSWIRTFTTAASETDEAENDENNNSDEENSEKFSITCLTNDENIKAVYAGTNKGLLASYDRGKSWQRLADTGLISRYIEDILVSGPDIIVATKKGVFTSNKPKIEWHSTSNGTMAYHTKRLVFDKNNKHIYAATVNGFYKYAFSNKEKREGSNKVDYIDFIKRQIENEPSIQQIQRAAIEYAEVSSDKIKNMRQAARNKAWLPKLSIGFDGGVERAIGLDRGGTSDPDFYIIGPEEKDFNWDVDLSWDLGELIWNDDQTNIDVRSKLMVQLRDDILTEVTNLYFERRRLQMDIADGKYKEKAQDKAMLRLQELTARIDALTNGYLSKSRRGYEQ